MDFIEKLQEISSRIPSLYESISTEEATKTAFVMPFIQALGYNIFDPNEVIPEFTADVGTKKGEKVDYAVLRDGHPIILFECKWCKSSLDDGHRSQLYRYFSVTQARIGVLTNGIVYRFYSDLEDPNKMDKRPYLEIDLAELDENLVGALKKLTKGAFDIEEIVSEAGELKYTRQMKKVLTAQLAEPDDDFVRFLTSKVYEGRLVPSVREQFTEITRKALNQFVNEQLNSRLKTALGTTSPVIEESSADEEAADEKESDAAQETKAKSTGDIVTTTEEMEAFLVVRAILCADIEVERVVMRDTKSYCGIILDDNRTKPICRLWFNAATVKYLGVFNEDKKEERVKIEKVSDIYKHADLLRKRVSLYTSEASSAPQSSPQPE